MVVSADSERGRWKDKPPPDQAWKSGSRNRSKKAMTAEQDRAAGGHHLRYKDLGASRRSCASIVLRLPPKNRRIRAYLRWSDKGRYPEKYVGEVDRDTREENLMLAWRMVFEQGLLAADSDCRDGAG
jgi:DNA mismatch endonuclease (patch repair protein)